MLDLVLLDEVFLLEGLDRVNLLRVLLLAKDDLSVGARADDLHQLEIVNR